LSVESPSSAYKVDAGHGYQATKRAVDVTVSLICLVIMSPILGTAMLAVKLTSPGPVVFRQERLGYHGRTFTIWKLRTMTDATHSGDTQVIGNHPGVTRVGRSLRRFKIDELPQLLNVLIGDMSLVGPRPGLPEHLQQYTPLAHRRLAVVPGLTGLAQVSGNIHLSWPERWSYDAKYVETMSFWLDMKIIVKTMAVIVFGERRFLGLRSGE